jgi:hypothetical protein
MEGRVNQKEYNFKDLQMTTNAVNVLQEFEKFLNGKGATLEGDINIKVSEFGDVTASVKMFLPVELIECNSQSPLQEDRIPA